MAWRDKSGISLLCAPTLFSLTYATNLQVVVWDEAPNFGSGCLIRTKFFLLHSSHRSWDEYARGESCGTSTASAPNVETILSILNVTRVRLLLELKRWRPDLRSRFVASPVAMTDFSKARNWLLSKKDRVYWGSLYSREPIGRSNGDGIICCVWFFARLMYAFPDAVKCCSDDIPLTAGCKIAKTWYMSWVELWFR